MAEAKLNRDYALRILGVGALMFGISVWSIYDGSTAWPERNREMALARACLLATNLTPEVWIRRDEERVSALDAIFARHGVKPPSKLIRKLDEMKLASSAPAEAHAQQRERMKRLFEEPIYSEQDLRTQFIQAAVTFGLGALAWGAVARKARRRFTAGPEGLSGSGLGGRVLRYDDLVAIDWSRWDDKGILRLTFKDGTSQRLDGWHFAGMTGVADVIARQRPDLAPARGAEARREQTGRGHATSDLEAARDTEAT